MLKNYIRRIIKFHEAKKSRLGLFMIMLLFSNVYSKVDLGVMAGMNHATLISEPQGLLMISNNQYFGAGAVGEYHFSKNVSIRLGLLYLGKGTKFKIQGLNEVNAKLDLENLSLPFSINYSFSVPYIQPYIHTGLFIEYNLTANLQYKSPDYISNEDVEDKISDHNFGYLIGGGFKKGIGKLLVFTEINYSRGLLNLYHMDMNSDSSIYTEGIQIFLGFKYTVF